MADPNASASPELAREYSKLFTAASKHREVPRVLLGCLHVLLQLQVFAP